MQVHILKNITYIGKLRHIHNQCKVKTEPSNFTNNYFEANADTYYNILQ